jgi:L-threonylcarbamoyladenylate synthase
MSQATEAEIAHAAALLRDGRLVAFPTETVYGLGANALDSKAVARIYAVKRRPATSPLIVHVSSIEMAKSLISSWPETAEVLAKKFWPGPLTLVLSTSRVGADAFVRPARESEAANSSQTKTIPSIVTAGLSTVALRMPRHSIALALIEAAGVPLAAPSANRFTELSPTTAEHVRKSLGHEVDYILDGGPCTVGIESTVLSLVGKLGGKLVETQSQPILLRPGAISRKELEALIGSIASAQEIEAGPHPAPGMHPRHYSPITSLFLVTNGIVPELGQGIYLQHEHPPSRQDINIHQMPQSVENYAAVLYEKLHQADAANTDWIAVDQPPQGPEWEAINDRLKRAAIK